MLFSLAGCLEGPKGAQGPQGLEGPKGEAGLSPSASELATLLMRDHLEELRGPKGDPGLSPTAAAVAEELITNHLPELRAPAAAYQAVDAHGQVLGLVTGINNLLWNEQLQGYLAAPSQTYFPTVKPLYRTIPPGFQVLFTNMGCVVQAAGQYVEFDGRADHPWLTPLYFGLGNNNLYGTALDSTPIPVTVNSRLGPDGICVNETRDATFAVPLDLEATLPSWYAPMTLVPTPL